MPGPCDSSQGVLFLVDHTDLLQVQLVALTCLCSASCGRTPVSWVVGCLFVLWFMRPDSCVLGCWVPVCALVHVCPHATLRDASSELGGSYVGAMLVDGPSFTVNLHAATAKPRSSRDNDNESFPS